MVSHQSGESVTQPREAVHQRGLTWNRLLVRLVDEFPDERETEITGCISQVRGSEDLTADEA